MAESIFIRVKRIVSANIQGAVDAMERADGEAVMREAIREVERAVDEVRSEMGRVTTRRLQAGRQIKMFEERLAELTKKAAFAVEQGRDDLAEAAISRQVDFEAQILSLQRVLEETAPEEAKLENCLAELTARKRQMEDELKCFIAARKDASYCAAGPENTTVATGRKVDRAEAAFARAMDGATGLAGMTRPDAAAHAKVIEIDVLQRSSEIKGRLAALKSNRMAG